MDSNIENNINECLKIIESQLLWGSIEQWKQRDFEQLSDLILEKTGTRLSLSTLKRICTGQFTNAPQLATLNALAKFAGFSSWNDFRVSPALINQRTDNSTIPESKKTANKKSYKRLPIILGIFLISGIASLIFLVILSGRKETPDTSVALIPKVNFRHKILAEELPNTVVFSFELDKLEADSFFFQQTWDYQTRVPIPSKSKNFTSVYYYPGYHTAKLFAGKTQVAEQKIHVKTNGWLGLVTTDMNKRMPVYLDNPVHHGMLYAPMSESPIQQLLANKSDFRVRYYNISDFKDLTGDDFQLSANIRNNIEHGGQTCQDVLFYVFCESGMIMVPFSMPGCVGNLNLLASDNYLAGRNNDLSALGINLSDWQHIDIQAGENNIRIKTSSNLLSASYSRQLGEIKGLMIEFRGSGAIDMISLGNKYQKTKYNWVFD